MKDCENCNNKVNKYSGSDLCDRCLAIRFEHPMYNDVPDHDSRQLERQLELLMN